MEVINTIQEDRYIRAKKKVACMKGFYRHLLVYVCVNICITSVHVVNDMWNGASFISTFWDIQTFFIWVPWGVGLLIHGIFAFNMISFFIGKNWEDKKIQELMERDTKNSSIDWK